MKYFSKNSFQVKEKRQLEDQQKKNLQLLFKITWIKDLMGEWATICMESCIEGRKQQLVSLAEILVQEFENLVEETST